MDTLLVRLRPLARSTALRCFTYRGIRFHVDRGWYRVPKDIGEYLRGVRVLDTDASSPLAFDVATEDDAKRLDADEQAKAQAARASAPIATEPRPVAPAGIATSPGATAQPSAGADGRRVAGKRE